MAGGADNAAKTRWSSRSVSLESGPNIRRWPELECRSGTLGGRVRKGVSVAVAAFLACAASGTLQAWSAGGGQVVGLRRLTEQEYRNSIADIFGKDIVVQGVFEPGLRMGGLVAT